MTAELTHGRFRIISLTEGNRPTSIIRGRPGSQLVRLGESVDVWTIKQEGDTYRLSIGGYPFTGINDDKVIVSLDPEENVEWIVTRREFHKAYTIQPARDEFKGWTIPRGLSIHPEIEIRPIISTKSIPPHFLPTQLFRFERVESEEE